MSKYDKYNGFILSNKEMGFRPLTRLVIQEFNLPENSASGLRKHIKRLVKSLTDNSAIEEYC